MKKIYSSVPLALFGLLVLLALSACKQRGVLEVGVAHAALDVDYFPTLTDDMTVNGSCSLREAFRAIYTRLAVDTCPAGRAGLDYNNIHLPAGTLSASLIGIDDTGLLGDFDVGANMRIYGATTGETILDMNSVDRAFQASGSYSFEIYDLTIREGCANGGTCTTDVTNGIAHGGGVFYSGFGTFRFVRSRIEGSRARAGGGLALYNSASANNLVEDSEIVGNTANLGGGGIDANVNWTLRNAIVERNSAALTGSTGAGIRQWDRVATIEASIVRDNTSLGAGGGASAVGNFSGTTAGRILVDSTSFENNVANIGGGNLFANAGLGGLALFSVPCAATGCVITVTDSSVIGGIADQPVASAPGSGGNLLANASSSAPGRFELRGDTSIAMGQDASTPSAPDCQGDVRLFDRSSVANATGCSIQDQRPMGPVCGNGVIEAGEPCDGGPCCVSCAFSTASCSDGNTCTVGDVCNGAGTCVPGTGTRCGDGLLEVTCGEQCDDGARISQDGCSATCQLEQCISWISTASSPPVDASVPDASVSDASVSDASVPDASVPDASTPDAASCEPWTDTVDVPTGFLCNQEPPPDQGPFAMRVALTFDDGPNSATTPAILATLRARSIPATFFFVGQRLLQPANAALAREIHLDPLFRVASHTYTHADLSALDLAGARREIDDTIAEIQSALGAPCFYPRFFRFPQGRSNCGTAQLVRERGFGIAGVNIDSLDWCYASSGTCPRANFPQIAPENESDMIGHALAQLARTQGGIMLMHDIHQRTADLLPELLDRMIAAGVTFVRLDDTAVFPQINAQVQTPQPPACCHGVVP